MTNSGSGKTYLAAFDALNFNPKRLLYIVHEGSILRKSLETFQEIFGKNVTYGIYSGTSKEAEADFVFATNITMSNTLELFSKNEFDYIVIDECHHAIKYFKIIKCEGSSLKLDTELEDQLVEYTEDLIDYGLTRYQIDYGDETGFKLWQNYRMDQVQLKLLKNPANNQVGTYYYDDYVVIFASLKKDLDEADKLNYKDKFLQSDLFQWESMRNLPQIHLDKLKKSSFAHIFIRKVSIENGLVLPFTYVGKGKLLNPRRTDSGNGTYLFDIHMENALPEYLQYDFGLTK